MPENMHCQYALSTNTNINLDLLIQAKSIGRQSMELPIPENLV